MRRGSVMFIVIWALAIGALVLSSVQLFCYRQAMMGRQALARTQARWGARAGLEWMIAIMADHTLEPVPGDAFAMVRELDGYYYGELEAEGRVVATWDIRYDADGRQWRGPADEHAKLNINGALENPALLNSLEDMSPDIADAILDWIDDDDDERPIGAERNYYLSLSMPYEPRNGPMRSIAELELVAGIWPEHLRGEDWNLNSRLDQNENDGERTWPPDDPDEILDSRWSGLMTALSTVALQTGSGLPRIDLRQTDAQILMERTGLEEAQAEALISWASGDNQMSSLLTAQVQANLASQRSGSSSTPGGNEEDGSSGLTLTNDELRIVMDETMIGPPPRGRVPGKLNLNTVSEELLLQLLEDREHLVDEILYLRRSRPEGIASLVDLIEIPAFQDDTASLEYLASIADVRSSVYSAAIRGRSETGGLEVEIYVVLDRSTLPIRILEYRE